MRKRYNTTQRTEVIECLAEAAPAHLTAAGVHRMLAQAGSTTSAATVYRQLDRLVSEGIAVKVTPEGEKRACYALVNRSSCHKERCYHLKCEKCGQLIHINCEELGLLGEHMRAEHGFSIDMGRTVLLGVCEACTRNPD